jgi:hypothetical protein
VQDDVKYKKKILAIIEAIVKAKYGKDQKRKTRHLVDHMGDKVPYLPHQTRTDYKREYTEKKPPKIPLAQTDPPRRYYFVKEYEKTHIYPHPMEKETNY